MPTDEAAVTKDRDGRVRRLDSTFELVNHVAAEDISGDWKCSASDRGASPIPFWIRAIWRQTGLQRSFRATSDGSGLSVVARFTTSSFLPNSLVVCHSAASHTVKAFNYFER